MFEFGVANRPGRAEERKASLLTLSCAEDCTKLHDMLKTAVAQVHNGEHFNRSTESEHSVQRSEKPGMDAYSQAFSGVSCDSFLNLSL